MILLKLNVTDSSLNSVNMKDTAVFIVDIRAGNCALETKEAKASAVERTKQLCFLTGEKNIQNKLQKKTMLIL